MDIHFITYGNENFSKSVKRICKEARNTNIFSSIKRFGPKDLPESITASPLMIFERGGGYWLWKPYIIWNELKKLKIGDILVYVDSGSSIHKSDVWNYYFNLLKDNNAVLFKYNEIKDYKWSTLDPNFVDSTKIKHWLKDSGIRYFDSLFREVSNWEDNLDKLWAGLIIVKKVEKFHLIEEWMKAMLFNPKIVMDLFAVEENSQIKNFASHRHDQAILSPLAYYYKNIDKICIINEDSESPFIEENPAVKKGSILAENIKSPLYSKLRNILKRVKNLTNTVKI